MEELIAYGLLVAVIMGAVSFVGAVVRWLGDWRDARKIRRADRKVTREERLTQALNQRLQRELELYGDRRASEAAAARQKRLRHAGIELQRALQQLPQSRDFRRAASIAAACRELPVPFRRRQYQRHKKLILEQAVACLQNRIDRQLLCNSLADLLQYLGVARFEAEYIIDAAARSLQEQIAPRKTPDFAAQLEEELREHQRKVRAIESLPGDPTVVEQMLEIEHRRHASVLLQLTSGRRAGDEDVVTL
jgi:hypothetical protein